MKTEIVADLVEPISTPLRWLKFEWSRLYRADSGARERLWTQRLKGSPRPKRKR
jgi:hypothetical protein